MLELSNISTVLSGVAIRDNEIGTARFVRLSDLSDLKAGRLPNLVRGECPAVARALAVADGDLIVGARGATTDVCVASDALLGAFVSLDLYLVRPNRALVEPDYLAAFLELPPTQALFTAGRQGSSLARLPKDALEKTEVPLPPLRAQRLIADLARSSKVERKLLNRLADLKTILGREAVAHAIARHVNTRNTL